MTDVYHAQGGVEKRKGRPDRTPPSATFTLGVTKPTRANSGLPAGWTPAQTITALFQATTAGATYTDIRFDNYVEVRAADVTFVRCEFRGPSPGPTSPASYILRCNFSTTLRARLEFCDIVARAPAAGLHGVEGHDYVAYRCYVKNVVDGFNVYNTQTSTAPSNVQIQGCCVELLAYFAGATYQSDNMTHNDAIQHQGGSGTQIVGNTLMGYIDPTVGDAGQPATYDGNGTVISGYRWSRSPIPAGFYANSCIQFNDNVGTSTDVLLDRNWLDGGGATVNIPAATMTGISITNNRFGQHARLGSGFNILAPVELPISITGNTDEATGASANQRANG